MTWAYRHKEIHSASTERGRGTTSSQTITMWASMIPPPLCDLGVHLIRRRVCALEASTFRGDVRIAAANIAGPYRESFLKTRRVSTCRRIQIQLLLRVHSKLIGPSHRFHRNKNDEDSWFFRQHLWLRRSTA